MSAATLPPYKTDFLQAAINGGVLKFGSFELKSKRISPYFFNAGEFYRADLLRALSTAYAKTIIEANSSSSLEFDILFTDLQGYPHSHSYCRQVGGFGP
jgi:orotate phosphoribosyltransferase